MKLFIAADVFLRHIGFGYPMFNVPVTDWLVSRQKKESEENALSWFIQLLSEPGVALDNFRL